ncbi:MAG: glycosyltransferase family 2 protein [Candidatus Hydrogenedentes bacterium]|nr:glycosyltransferase family 2 protein [Candidatus Hydrogenedentota bacterium]
MDTHVTKPLVSVVVPFYNEAENVPPLMERIAAVFDQLSGYEYECVFVNDGSTDGTRVQLEKLHAANSRVRPIHLLRNSGQSAALVAGLRRARGELVFTLDGDLQNDPCDFPKMLELLKEYDCVCGYRANRHDTWVRKVSSRIANRVRNWALQDGIRDGGCGAKAFRRKCLEHIVPFNGAHRFLAVMMRKAGFTIVECEVTHHPREFGVSKYGIGNRLWRGIYDLIGVGWLRKRYVVIRVEGEE